MGGLDFRNLHKFNEALLAKQVWHLMNDTSSLFYQVFKAKFFPHCSILETDTKTRGSYAWQSIIKTRKVILKGGAWQVGTGNSIKIWKHRWLLEDNHRTIITHGPQLLQDCTVDQLILQPKMEWDNALIDKLFLPYDAEAVKNIPLSERAPPKQVFFGLEQLMAVIQSKVGTKLSFITRTSSSLEVQPMMLSNPFGMRCGHSGFQRNANTLYGEPLVKPSLQE